MRVRLQKWREIVILSAAGLLGINGLLAAGGMFSVGQYALAWIAVTTGAAITLRVIDLYSYERK